MFKNNNTNKARPYLIILIVLLIAVIAFLAILLLSGTKKTNDDVSLDLTDEFTRAKDFINDWNLEVNRDGKGSVYLNEIKSSDGKYTLTYAEGRIRAVYPRGVRYFKLEHITKVEFLVIDNILRCRFSYGENNEYMFKVN